MNLFAIDIRIAACKTKTKTETEQDSEDLTSNILL